MHVAAFRAGGGGVQAMGDAASNGTDRKRSDVDLFEYGESQFGESFGFPTVFRKFSIF